eukprot:snap_masked-scaffold_1-processed-gene-5.17-mRNA-1 protein AED:1.00 eAED:1.00 QI:0/0/0/0/1/1/4/0/104
MKNPNSYNDTQGHNNYQIIIGNFYQLQAIHINTINEQLTSSFIPAGGIFFSMLQGFRSIFPLPFVLLGCSSLFLVITLFSTRLSENMNRLQCLTRKMEFKKYKI